MLARAVEAAAQSRVRELIVFGEAPGATPFAALLAHDGPLPDVAIDPRRDVAAILCSSGTTGLPKGAQLTHLNLVASACQFAASCPIGDDDTMPAQLPFFHLFGLVISLTYGPAEGARSVVIPRFDLAQFLQIAQDYRVTRAFLTPPTVLALAKDPIVDRYDLSAFASILSGAAPLGEEMARACAERVGCVVKQGYGMTEIVPTHAAPDDLDPAKVGTVGPCTPQTECMIVDIATGEELGPNQTGEILARGPAATPGYLNQPQATAQLIDADGWVHTGDVGFVDDDGYLTVVDRVKELIKYKAYQVAPAELEAVLLAHPMVADAAVIRSPDEEAGEVPKAFVVLRGEASAEDLMAFVAERVAPYKKVRRLEFVGPDPEVTLRQDPAPRARRAGAIRRPAAGVSEFRRICPLCGRPGPCSVDEQLRTGSPLLRGPAHRGRLSAPRPPQLGPRPPHAPDRAPAGGRGRRRPAAPG